MAPDEVGKKGDQETGGPAPKQAAEAAQSSAELGAQEAAEKASTPGQGSDPPAGGASGTPEAEDTAARTTGIDKLAADTLAPDGVDVQQAVADAEDEQAETGSAAASAQRRRRGSRGRGARRAGTEPKTAAATEPEAASATEPEADAATEPQAETATEAPAEPAARPSARARRAAGAAPVVRAQARYVRTSARKARLVCDHIRGKSVQDARAVLAYTPRAVARDWSKVLESAVANAENNHELVGDELRILAAFADEGPTLKRFRPRAMGRATRIRKRTSHLTITLTPKES